MKIIAIVTAAALGLTTAAAAYAASTQTVSFADLDVASAAGQSVLAARVARAADRVCGVENGNTDLASHIAARNCSRQAIASAMFGVSLKVTPQYASR